MYKWRHIRLEDKPWKPLLMCNDSYDFLRNTDAYCVAVMLDFDWKKETEIIDKSCVSRETALAWLQLFYCYELIEREEDV